MSFGREEISWENLDKRKFYTLGIGIFSGVTTCLYPLTVVKTRNIAGPIHLSGLRGVQHTATEIWRNDRIRGFYKGFGTVCVGTIPARVVYMSVLELAKSGYRGSLHQLGFSDAAVSGAVNFFAGATASLCSQTVYVPIDVVSQRLMVLNNDPGSTAKRMNGLSMAKLIIRQEGIGGLWKGFFASIGTYVPNSAIWWGLYGFLQKVLWTQLDRIREDSFEMSGTTRRHYLALSDSAAIDEHADVSSPPRTQNRHSANDVLAIQTTAALFSGVTSAFFTTPLDVVKTRMQLSVAGKGKRITAFAICQQIFQEQGVGGFMRGVLPRAANVALWGTCMVSAYEFLKRAAALSN